MEDAERRGHLAEDRVQLAAAADPVDQRFDPGAHRIPVEPAQFRVVGEVAVHAPRIDEHLVPFGFRIDLQLPVAHPHLLAVEFAGHLGGGGDQRDHRIAGRSAEHHRGLAVARKFERAGFGSEGLDLRIVAIDLDRNDVAILAGVEKAFICIEHAAHARCARHLVEPVGEPRENDLGALRLVVLLVALFLRVLVLRLAGFELFGLVGAAQLVLVGEAELGFGIELQRVDLAAIGERGAHVAIAPRMAGIGRKIAVGHEIEPRPVMREGGGIIVVLRGGRLHAAAGGEILHEDRAAPARSADQVFGVGDVFPVGREADAGEGRIVARPVLRQLGDAAGRDVDLGQPRGLVPGDDRLAIGRDVEAPDIRIVPLRDRLGFTGAVGGHAVEIAMHVLIEDQIDIFAVRALHRIARPGIERDREFDPPPLLGKAQRNPAARGDRDALARRRHPRRRHVLQRIGDRAFAGLFAVGHDIDRQLAHRFGGGREDVDVGPVLEEHFAVIDRRLQHGEGHLLRFLPHARSILGDRPHRIGPALIGDEVDPAAIGHRHADSGGEIGQQLGRLAIRAHAPFPQLRGAAPAIHHRIVAGAGIKAAAGEEERAVAAIGRIVGAPQRDRLRIAAFGADRVKHFA